MCTTFSIYRDNDTILGRTMDLEKYHKYEFKFFSKNYNYEEDAFGNKLYIKYKIMGTTFKHYEHLLDGLNEKGLLGCANLFKNVITFTNQEKKDKLNLTSTKLLNVLLTNCATIDEIKKFAKKIHIVKESFFDKNNISRHYHFMFSDINGKSVIVEINNGNLDVIDNPYNIMTNSPKFQTHIIHLQKYLQHHILKGSLLTPTKRFLRAYDELTSIKKENSNLSNKTLMFNSLKKFTIQESDYDKKLLKSPNITLYYSAISSKEKKYYIKYTNSNIINCFSFDDFTDITTKTIVQIKK